ncbi:MAG: metalloregulator ArsR/SmtB family transcription factor [Minisyncoccia bacterium]
MENHINIYKTFSNKNRVQLILCLAYPKSVTELHTHCKLSQSALSQHLKVLKDAGVVSCVREGKKQIYSIRNKKIVQIAKLLEELSVSK